MQPVNEVEVEKEYAKNALLKKNDVIALLEWAQKQPHLPTINEFEAISFLVRCNYSNEDAKSKIEEFYTVRARCPEIFADKDPEFVKKDLFLICPLPKETLEGHQTVMLRFMHDDPTKYSCREHLKLIDMVMMLLLYQKGTTKGVNILVDMTSTSFGHIARLDLGLLKKFLYYLQEVIPLYIAQLHFINVNALLDKVLMILRPLLKKELLEKLHVHVRMETLYDFIQKDCLPEEYGGKCGNLSKLLETNRKNLLENASFFLEDQKQMADETKRIAPSKNVDQLFGIEGTFKKLDID